MARAALLAALCAVASAAAQNASEVGAVTLGALPATGVTLPPTSNRTQIAPAFLSAVAAALASASRCAVTIKFIRDAVTGESYYVEARRAAEAAPAARRAAATAVLVSFRAVGAPADVAAATTAQTGAFTAAVAAALAAPPLSAAGITVRATSSAAADADDDGRKSYVGMAVGVAGGVLVAAAAVACVLYRRAGCHKRLAKRAPRAESPNKGLTAAPSPASPAHDEDIYAADGSA